MENKIFSLIEKYFFKVKEGRYTHCLYCGNQLIGSQRKFCSDSCNGYYNRNKFGKENTINDELREKDNKKRTARRYTSHTKIPLRKLKTKCYMCEVKKAVLWHHPNYDLPEITYAFCRSCHKKHHALLLLQGRTN